jgi:hypothetical protein
MITLKEMVKQYLEQNFYDGLASNECGCSKDNLFPCGEPKEDCKAAYLVNCCNCGKCDNVDDSCYFTSKEYYKNE